MKRFQKTEVEAYLFTSFQTEESLCSLKFEDSTTLVIFYKPLILKLLIFEFVEDIPPH